MERGSDQLSLSLVSRVFLIVELFSFIAHWMSAGDLETLIVGYVVACGPELQTNLRDYVIYDLIQDQPHASSSWGAHASGLTAACAAQHFLRIWHLADVLRAGSAEDPPTEPIKQFCARSRGGWRHPDADQC